MKVQNLQKFLYKVKKKKMNCDWCQIPAKRTDTKSTAWLQTLPDPTIDIAIASSAFIATRVATVTT
jgi:hypothetical protein